ncbi:MAG: TIGR03000 domain-containing protein [Gemmataceae bacterium]|nr:TIGR03000 domain-containing protein [Gemmataceae bacterium]
MKSRVVAFAFVALAGLMLTARAAQANDGVTFGIGFRLGLAIGHKPYYGPTYPRAHYGPYHYGPYYYAPRVVYALPAVVVVPVVPLATVVVPPVTYVQPATYVVPIPAVASQPATIVVRLADLSAHVYFDDTLTQQTGAERRFHTPPLVFGANNSYTIRAVSPASGFMLEQRVRVTPGQSIVIDFNRGGSEGLPAPR